MNVTNSHTYSKRSADLVWRLDMLMTMTFLILSGNTCYPIFLRLVWTFLKLIPRGESWSDRRKTLQFLLDHPRRCYTNMFPAQHTWWLLAAVVTLNSIDWMAFDIMKSKATRDLPTGIRILDSLFQAVAVRYGGFYVDPISNIRIGLQVLYVVMPSSSRCAIPTSTRSAVWASTPTTRNT